MVSLISNGSISPTRPVDHPGFLPQEGGHLCCAPSQLGLRLTAFKIIKKTLNTIDKGICLSISCFRLPSKLQKLGLSCATFRCLCGIIKSVLTRWELQLLVVWILRGWDSWTGRGLWYNNLPVWLWIMVYHWIGLRENLQEARFLPWKNWWVPVKSFINQWILVGEWISRS